MRAGGDRRGPVAPAGDIAVPRTRSPDVAAGSIRPTAPARTRPIARTPADRAAAVRAWGRLPEISVAVATGLLLVAYATRLARDGSTSASAASWLGIVVMLLPVAARIAFAAVGRVEAIGLLAVVGTGLYLTRVARNPGGLTGLDELIHYRTASDVLATGHLYGANPMLPVSSVVPGLEIVTSAIAETTGLSLVTSGLVLIGVARLLLIVSLFLLLHELSRSVRLAATATLLYAGSSTFYAFDTQYSYGSLAVGLGAFLLYLAARLTRTRRAQPAPRALVLVALIVGLALAFTHHLTALATACLLVGWATVHLLLHRRLPHERNPLVIGLAVGIAVLAWSVVVASDVFSHLGGPVVAAVDGIRGLLHDGSSFEAVSGSRAGRFERLVGTVGIAVTVVAVPLGLLALRRQAPRRALTVVLVLLAVLYPASLVLRDDDGAWEVSSRASGFLFLGVAFVVAYAVWRCRVPAFVPRIPRARQGIVAALCVLVPVSGTALGSDANRLPRPYAVGDGPRAIDPHGIGAASWARRELGSGNRVAADRTNTALMNAYGDQDVVGTVDRGVTVSPLFLSTVVGAYERDLIRRGGIGYLVVDRRIEGATTPPDGSFYENGELTLYPDAYSPTAALDPARLRKWDGVDGVSRVFDDGSLVLYDVRAVRDAP